MASRTFGLLSVDLESDIVMLGTQRIHLQRQPMRMLELILAGNGMVVTKGMIMRRLYEGEFYLPSDRIIDVQVCRLNQLFPGYLVVVWGRGYFAVDPELPHIWQESDALPVSPAARWVVKRKAAVVKAIESGQLSLADARAAYRLSQEEYDEWKTTLTQFGLYGLRTTRRQAYATPLSRSPI